MKALLICVLAGCGASGQVEPTTSGEIPALASGTVTEVHDGDTVVVESGGRELEVRLTGVNAPEVTECFHDEAADHLQEMIQGREVGIEEVEIDQFGRTLAYLWLDGAQVNLELVAAGYAIAVTPEDRTPSGVALIEAEEGAFSTGLGLWAAEACGATGPIPEVTVDDRGFDPPGPDEEALDEEWVALESTDPTNVGGWTVRDESSAHRCALPPGTTLTQGTPHIVTSADPCWEPGGSPVWNNGGDMVLLLDTAGRVVARSRYPR